MGKKCRGSFTIEASFLLPAILFFYLLIILAALFLYCRCVISQDSFLLGMRAARFTWGGESYGEVLYGEEEKKAWKAEAYVQERLLRKAAGYPVYSGQRSRCVVGEHEVVIQTEQKGAKSRIIKRVEKFNPVEIIREGRRKQNA